jgi:hypothetical protein
MSELRDPGRQFVSSAESSALANRRMLAFGSVILASAKGKALKSPNEVSPRHQLAGVVHHRQAVQHARDPQNVIGRASAAYVRMFERTEWRFGSDMAM